MTLWLVAALLVELEIDLVGIRPNVFVTTTGIPRQHYNLTLAILTMAGTAYALQQTMVFPALSTFEKHFDTTPAWATWVLTAFLLTASVATPLLGKLGDQYGKERMLLVALTIFLVGTIGGSVRLEHRLADRLSRAVRHRRCRLPAQLRDHPRRVPAREGQGRDRPALVGVRRRRRPRDRLLGPDRRVPVVALAVHRGRDPGGRSHPARQSLRPGIPDQDPGPPRHPRGRPARRRSHRAARCAHRGRKLGLDVPAVPGPDARECRPARYLDPHGAARRRADGRHADDEHSGRCC